MRLVGAMAHGYDAGLGERSNGTAKLPAFALSTAPQTLLTWSRADDMA